MIVLYYFLFNLFFNFFLYFLLSTFPFTFLHSKGFYDTLDNDFPVRENRGWVITVNVFFLLGVSVLYCDFAVLYNVSI